MPEKRTDSKDQYAGWGPFKFKFTHGMLTLKVAVAALMVVVGMAIVALIPIAYRSQVANANAVTANVQMIAAATQETSRVELSSIHRDDILAAALKSNQEALTVSLKANQELTVRDLYYLRLEMKDLKERQGLPVVTPPPTSPPTTKP